MPPLLGAGVPPFSGTRPSAMPGPGAPGARPFSGPRGKALVLRGPRSNSAPGLFASYETKDREKCGGCYGRDDDLGDAHCAVDIAAALETVRPRVSRHGCVCPLPCRLSDSLRREYQTLDENSDAGPAPETGARNRRGWGSEKIGAAVKARAPTWQALRSAQVGRLFWADGYIIGLAPPNGKSPR